MNSRSTARILRHGFTLIEILVVLAIMISLAALVFVGAQRATESARIAANINNIRNLGPALSAYAQENQGYPPGWSFKKQESWADVLIREKTGEIRKQQDPDLLSPLVARNIPRGLTGPTISNYSVSPIIFPSEPANGDQPYRVNPFQLQRASEQILLGDGLPRSADAAYGFSMIVFWGFRGAPSGNSWDVPPESNEVRRERGVSLPSNILEMEHDAGKGLPAFRNRGKGHFLFGDGHVESLEPGQLKYKHFAISY